MDELSAFRSAWPARLDREIALLGRADIVFAGGLSLYEAKRHRHPNVHAFPSSIDVGHFSGARRRRSERAMAPSATRPLHLGYFGVIDERIDLHLLASVADLRPDWHFSMVGPLAKIDPAALPLRPNIERAGPRCYADLPTVLAA